MYQASLCKEGVKELWQIVGGNVAAGISDDKLDEIALVLGLEPDLAVAIHRLHGVPDDVRKHALDLQGVDLNIV